jgi:hypothetical protein
VVLRLGSKSNTATTPNWTTDGASASATSTLLTERLAAATRYSGAILLSSSPLTGPSKERDYGLMNQVLIEFDPKSGLRNLNGSFITFGRGDC